MSSEISRSVAIKIINLDHRTDRRDACLEELRQVGLKEGDFQFFRAKYLEDAGARACAISHAVALAGFLANDERSHCLILEDDFQVTRKASFLEDLGQVMSCSDQWDVFLLAHNRAIPVAVLQIPGAAQVVGAQTTAGYIVGRRYAPQLIQTFFRSSELLRSSRNLPPANRDALRKYYCCDMLWKELQVTDRFGASVPPLVVQRASYSDVEKKMVDYGV